MGFPRILSKNNKIYTKLGEFCLSGDSFWIVCHTCQEELQTQDAFWKHIQDEHNFLHGVAKQEHSRTSSYCLTDVEAAAATAGSTTAQAGGSVTAVTVPLALYHCATKYSEEDQREVAAAVELHEAQQQQQQQQQEQQQQQHHHQQLIHQQQQRDAAKDMAELHAVATAAAAEASGESSTRTSSGIDIKVEPSSLALPPEMQAAAAVAAATANNTIYHLSQVVPAPPPPPSTPNFINVATATCTGTGTSSTVSLSTTPPHAALAGTVTSAPISNATSTPVTVMQQTCNTLSLTVSPATAAGIPLLAGQELVPKDSNSTTASASSAVSSDDGERWYICDFGACGLKFKYKSRMELHRVVHSKERRFNCDMCTASFKQSCNLSTHRKKKHSMRGIKSELLPQRF